MSKKAFIIVDVQNDFVEGGALGVDGGNKVAASLADFLLANSDEYDVLITTQDWHIDPGDHWSDSPDFVNTWPVHCAGGTKGAELVAPVANLVEKYEKNGKPVVHILKGLWTAAYSGFEGTESTTHKSIPEILADYGVIQVDVGGIATDYCVRATALDALKEEFHVTVFSDLVAGVAPETSKQSIQEMEDSGITVKSTRHQ